MPLALLVLIAVLALLIISALLVVVFALLIRLHPGPFGGPVALGRAVAISLALVGFVWLLMLINALVGVLVTLLLGA